jgi:uncharacterized protein (DUF697 family)
MNERTDRAYEIVGSYWKWSAVSGLIPVPILDVAVVTGVQLKMIADLAKLYGIPFREDLAKSVAGSLLGAASAPFLSTATLGVLSPALKFVPGIGTVLGVITMPGFNAAATYALGRVFIQHFESGGTFLDMDPEKVREHFQKEFEAAKAQPKREAATVAR